jgi:hypothetical protein
MYVPTHICWFVLHYESQGPILRLRNWQLHMYNARAFFLSEELFHNTLCRLLIGTVDFILIPKNFSILSRDKLHTCMLKLQPFLNCVQGQTSDYNRFAVPTNPIFNLGRHPFNLTKMCI